MSESSCRKAAVLFDYNDRRLAVMMEQGWKQHKRFHPLFFGFQPEL